MAYFPPTDFLNYGKSGQHFDKYIRKILNGKNPCLAALDFHHYDSDQNWLGSVTDEAKKRVKFREVAPVTHVSQGECTHVDHPWRRRQTGADSAGAPDYAQVQGGRRRGETARYARQGSWMEGGTCGSADGRGVV